MNRALPTQQGETMTTATAEQGIMAGVLEGYEPGIAARMAILRVLAEADRPVATRDLAALMPLAKSTVWQHVQVLKEAGYVKAKRGRNGGVMLTEAGRLALQD